MVAENRLPHSPHILSLAPQYVQFPLAVNLGSATSRYAFFQFTQNDSATPTLWQAPRFGALGTFSNMGEVGPVGTLAIPNSTSNQYVYVSVQAVLGSTSVDGSGGSDASFITFTQVGLI